MAVLVAATFAAVVTPALFTTGCSAVVTAGSGDRLTPDTTYSADLDGDRPLEQIFVDKTTRSLTISDGGTVYHSRGKWQVVEAYLGDTDHNGLLEVVTLLDADDGRHLGLFAYFGGEYRERLVTRQITPRPIALEVVNLERANTNPDLLTTLTGDMVVLTLEPGPGQTEPQTILCRWNGFGFTGIESAEYP